MTKLALVLAAVAALSPVAALAIQAEPAPAAPPAPPAVATPPAAPVDMANDSRMLAAIRHANARADQKCGNGAGVGITDLQTKMAARSCRRHMVDAAKLDAEFEINGH
ncbi:hypothetical protein [Polymorphobacter megasporae]|uniref:hypothetical protein n=1 Tax=Glacieibacterium megasporae TaxID=2835787 RepID=UPI001C1E4257|nr:hypothetical protein [Polymorphobacter megasporae]UAJ11657.1 hypothetical protein KTC28_08345 [Polymorphobacter megasporae]